MKRKWKNEFSNEKQKACGQNEKHSCHYVWTSTTHKQHTKTKKNKQTKTNKKEEHVPGKRIYFCLHKDRWVKLIRESTIRRNVLWDSTSLVTRPAIFLITVLDDKTTRISFNGIIGTDTKSIWIRWKQVVDLIFRGRNIRGDRHLNIFNVK